MIAADVQLRRTRQHAIALDALDHFLANRNVGGDHSLAAIGCTANHGFAPIPPSIDDRFHVVATRNRLHGFHSGGACAIEHCTRYLDALALGGFHRDELFECAGSAVEAGDELADPIVREFQNCSKNRKSPPCKWRISSIPYRIITKRVRPRPNAKPFHSSGSMPLMRRTFGFTRPQGSSSTQPPCLQTGHPEPPQIRHWISSSKPGSTNGKYPGRSRTVTSRLKIAVSSVFMKYSRLATDTSRSIIMPSS